MKQRHGRRQAGIGFASSDITPYNSKGVRYDRYCMRVLLDILNRVVSHQGPARYVLHSGNKREKTVPHNHSPCFWLLYLPATALFFHLPERYRECDIIEAHAQPIGMVAHAAE
jgi:hypothetical protein